jgi:hypothetical protein
MGFAALCPSYALAPGERLDARGERSIAIRLDRADGRGMEIASGADVGDEGLDAEYRRFQRDASERSSWDQRW